MSTIVVLVHFMGPSATTTTTHNEVSDVNVKVLEIRCVWVVVSTVVVLEHFMGPCTTTKTTQNGVSDVNVTVLDMVLSQP